MITITGQELSDDTLRRLLILIQSIWHAHEDASNEERIKLVEKYGSELMTQHYLEGKLLGVLGTFMDDLQKFPFMKGIS